MIDTTTKNTGKTYAEFAVRLFALGVDFFVVMFLANALSDHVLAGLYIDSSQHGFIVVSLLFVYFVGSWGSPLRATPAQLLFGMRVVSDDGRTLSFGRALVRGAALAALLPGTLLVFRAPPDLIMTSLGIAAFALASLAIVTPKRQGAHDFLARSLVVNRKALNAGAPLVPEKLSIYRTTTDLLVIAGIAFALWTASGAMHDRDRYHRTNYAFQATEGLRAAIEEFYYFEKRWPETELELGASTREGFPDGGYYEMGENGEIWIRFTVLPDLKKGSLVLSPGVEEELVEWTCRVDGDLNRRHLPRQCRDDGE